jgi:CHAD domain-containing protein
MAKTLQVVWNERIGPEANARRELPRLTAVFFADVRAALAARPSPDQLHRVRLAAKRMRYTLELFRPCYGTGLELRIESLRKLQQVLGEINDCAATRRVLAGNIPASPQRIKVERLLASRLRKKTGELRKLWKEELGAPGQELRWMRYLAHNARPPRPAKSPEIHRAKTEKAAEQHR